MPRRTARCGEAVQVTIIGRYSRLTQRPSPQAFPRPLGLPGRSLLCRLLLGLLYLYGGIGHYCQSLVDHYLIRKELLVVLAEALLEFLGLVAKLCAILIYLSVYFFFGSLRCPQP